jgi:hypothetical protein
MIVSRLLRSGVRGRAAFVLLLAGVILLVLTVDAPAGSSRAAIGMRAKASNPIVRENKKAGTNALRSLFSNARGGAAEGYMSEQSVSPGGVVQLHVSILPAAKYQIRIYRLGYYHGLGARLMTCLPSCRGALQGRPQPRNVTPDPTTGIVRANWPVTTAFHVPRSWVTGYYVFQLILRSGPQAGRVTNLSTVIRHGSHRGRLVVVRDVNTGAAYNSWGGKSLYTFNSTNNVAANHVSFDRPSAGVSIFDLPLIHLLELYGFDVSYTTDVDVQRDPAELLRYKFVLVLGHSEYWSRQMRDAYEAARDQGVNLGFFGGDIGDWQIRYEDNEHTVVGYKLAPDPNPDPSDKTTNFVRLRPSRPQCQLFGTQFTGGHGAITRYAINAAALSDPWFKGTGFKAGDTFRGNGFEYDAIGPPGCLPYPTTTFFADVQRPTLAPAVRYVAPSGAKVFGVGSYALTMTLDDLRVRRFTRNAITDLSR